MFDWQSFDWQSFDWQSILGALLTLGAAVMLFTKIMGLLQRRMVQKNQASISTIHAAREVNKERSTGIQNTALIATEPTAISVIDKEDGIDFFRQRLKQKAMQVHVAQHIDTTLRVKGNEIDRSLTAWATECEATAQHYDNPFVPAAPPEESIKSDSAEVDKALDDWANENKNSDITIEQTEQVILITSQCLQKESADLDYIINKLETSVDFISMEFQETLDLWKRGERYRNHSLEDLKRTFRLKTFSLDDAWHIVFSYPDWLTKQRKLLIQFVADLGVEALPEEDFLALVERAEKVQRRKALNMDMDIIFLLKELRKMFAIVTTMEQRLVKLQNACNKRSKQIITPHWESNVETSSNNDD